MNSMCFQQTEIIMWAETPIIQREKRSHLLEIPPASVSSGANVSSPLVHGTDGFARARGLDGCHDPGH